MGGHQEPSVTGSEIETTPVASATHGRAETNIQISDGPMLDDPATPSIDDDPEVSFFKVVGTALIFLIPTMIFLIVFSIVPLLVTLVLSLCFMAITILQLIRHGNAYDKATQLKFVIRLWLFFCAIWVTTAAMFFGTIARRIWNLELQMLMGVSVDLWTAQILSCFAGIYITGFVLNLFLHIVPPIPLGFDETGVSFQEAVFEIFDCLWVLMNILSVITQFSAVKQHKILGLYTWKWIRVSMLVVIGYNVVRLCTHLSAWLLRKIVNEKLDPETIKRTQHKLLVEKLMPREYIVYYANGLKRNITFILCSLITLLTWVLYLKPRLSQTPLADKILGFGTQTCISLLICSVLWLFKTWIVLSWEANAMYTRLKSQILESGKYLYFLGILGRDHHDIFKLTYYGPQKVKAGKNNRVLCISTMREFQERLNIELASYKEGKKRLRRPWDPFVAMFSVIFEMASNDFLNQSVRDKDEDDLDAGKVNPHRVKKLSTKKRETTKKDLLMLNRAPTMHDVKQVAEYLISAQLALSDPKIVSSILHRLSVDTEANIRKQMEKLIDDKSELPEREENNASLIEKSSASAINENQTTQNSNASPITHITTESAVESSTSAPPVHPTTVIEDPIQSVPTDDWEYFEKVVLKQEDCSTWLEKAKNRCLFLSNALSSTKEVVDLLNTIMSCLLVAATFILWLLLTRLATTELLVIIAAPFLAITFIFGDTCKTLFQGIMYVYVVHPLHVGDLCSVEDDKLVVKAVGVWTTTFCKVEKIATLEEVTYPNSELALKVVCNNLTDVIWDDSLEISLGCLQMLDVKKLKKFIKSHLKVLDKEENGFVPCSHSVAIEEDDDDLKFVIKLKYKISNIQDWSHPKCEQRKKTLQVFVDDLVREHTSTLNPSSSEIV